jgi:glucose/arabinose dehydrogenase
MKNLIILFFIISTNFALDDFDRQIIETEHVKLNVETFASGFDIPWGMAFLPDSTMLVTDLSGYLYHILSKDTLRNIDGAPDVFFKGQGGLMDVEIDPNYKENKIIYLSYSHQIGRKSFTALAKAKLDHSKLTGFKIIYSAEKEFYTRKSVHFGSRIAINGKYIFFSIGDRGERDDAQNLNTPNGKIHRVMLDGRIPDDNPFTSSDGVKSTIWSYGNRNPQGLTFSKSGFLWELEHGPRGGDELNIIKKGLNYGWPVITYGRNYTGTKITDYTHMDGMEQPIWHWTPSIAVCGMKIYEKDLIPEWNGNILVTSLKYEYLERVIVKNGKRIGSEKVFDAGSRVRDVEIGPLGNIYVALENPGRIVKISPIKY